MKMNDQKLGIMTRLFVTGILLFCGFLQAAIAQTTVTGKVTDAKSGESLPGVTVKVKGTQAGTTTDMDGKYELDVPKNGKTLVFSFVGYKKVEKEIGEGGEMNVKMEPDVMELDQMVVTALGVEKEKKALGYSTQELGSDEIEESGQNDVLKSMQSKVSGVNIKSTSGQAGGATNIRIRGAASISGQNQPLFVVDGTPVDNSQFNTQTALGGTDYSNRIADLNPDDIKSVNVLKGGAAAALYGSRAANGVVIIETKSGAGGTPGDQLNITVKSSATFSEVNKLPETQDTYAQGSAGQYNTGTSLSWGPKISEVDQVDQAYDNVGTFFRTGTKFKEYVSVSGGGARSNFFLSFSRLDQEGIVPGNDYDKTSIKLTGQTQIASWLSAKGNVQYVNSNSRKVQQGSNTSGVMLGLLRTPASFDNTNGVDPMEDSSAYENPDGTQRSYVGSYDNPYWTVNKNPMNKDLNRIISSANVTADPTPWLNITWRTGLDYYSDRRKQIFAINSRTSPAGGIIEDQYFDREINSDFMVTANTDFSDKLSGSLMLGHNWNQRFNQNLQVNANGLAIPEFYNISNAESFSESESQSIIRTTGLYSEGKLSYEDYLFLNLTGRMDKSSTFRGGEEFFFYPSANVGFVFTDALGMGDNDILPYGKLRVSVSQVANQPPAFATKTRYAQPYYNGGFLDVDAGGSGFPFNGRIAYGLEDDIGNADLEPEKTKSFEVGTDLRFLSNRIGLDFTYYSTTGTKQIFEVPQASSSGYSSKILNAGEISNEGIEIRLRVTPVKSENFKWDLTGNFSRNTNMVESLAPGVEEVGLVGFAGITSNAVAGEEYGTMFGERFQRTDDGELIIDPNTGYPVQDPEEGTLGNPNPDWKLGITNKLEYKGIKLSALLEIKQGGELWNGTRGALDFFGRSKGTAENDRSQPRAIEGVIGEDPDGDGIYQSTGQKNNIKINEFAYRVQGPGSVFTGPAGPYVEDASWVRLRNVSLSYTFSPDMLKNTFFQSISVTAGGNNLLLITDYTGIDPETNLTGATNGQGLDYFNMPSTKNYTFSVKFNL